MIVITTAKESWKPIAKSWLVSHARITTPAAATLLAGKTLRSKKRPPSRNAAISAARTLAVLRPVIAA